MAKIEQQGLKNYLDSCIDFHNGQGYNEFVFYMAYRVPVAAIGRMFFVDIKTIKKWRDILNREGAKK